MLWVLWMLLILLIMLLLVVLMLLQLVRVVVVVEDLVLGHELHADQVWVLLPGCGVLLWVLLWVLLRVLLWVLRGVGRVVALLLPVLRVLVCQGPGARAGGVEEGLLGDVLVPARQPAPPAHHHPAATRHVGQV